MSAWLQEWLQELNLMEYYPLLLEQRLVSPDVMARVDKAQLMGFGVTKVGHLNRLNNAIMRLAPSSPTSVDGPTQSHSNPSSPPPLSSSREHLDKVSTLPARGASPRGPSPSAPPVPMRRSTKRRSQSPGYTMSVTEDMLRSRETSPVNRLSPQPPPRPVSKHISDSSIKYNTLGYQQQQHSLPTSPSFSPTRSLGGDSSGSEGGSSRVTSPTSPRTSSYENVGPSKSGPPPKPPPRVSSHLSCDAGTGDETPPIPPQTRSTVSNLPSLPTVNSYEEILDKEVWSGGDAVTPGDYTAISDVVLPPALTHYEEVTTGGVQSETTLTHDPPPPAIPRRVSVPPSFIPPTPPLETSPSPTPPPDHAPVAPPRRGSMSNTQQPPMAAPRRNSTSKPLPVPPKETSPPPGEPPVVTPEPPPPTFSPPPPTFSPPPPSVSVSPPPSISSPLPPLPNFTPPPPPTMSSDYYEIQEEHLEQQTGVTNEPPLPNFTPPPPPTATAVSSDYYEIEEEHLEEVTKSPPPTKPRPSIPTRKSSLPIPEPDNTTLSQPPPPFTPSPPPSINEEKESPSPLPPPPIPRRGTLPPPPPPPITYEDHPDCIMEDPETYVTASSTSMGDGDSTPTSDAGSSPLIPPMRISQLSSGSESSIRLTPPNERAHQSDSDSTDGSASPRTTPTSSNASTLVMRSTLQTLKEDTLLADTQPPRHAYESVPSPAKPRPKSTFIEEKQNSLFSSTAPRDNLSTSYNSYLEDAPVNKRVVPTSQSVKNLAKDLERQTLQRSATAMPRSRTDSDVSERQSTVPQTAEGFLHKKGGKRNERPYQKRWVVFDGEVLKYFKQKGVKEMDARNNVKLSEMIDVKRVADPDQMNRFDLVVINRVFQFFADTEENAQLWVNVLHAAITKFNPSENDGLCKEGGNMNNPDKQGFLAKQGHGRFAAASGFKQRYVALKESRFAYYDTKEDFISGKPIHILDMRLANVRPDMTGKAPRFTITMPNQRSYVFQALTNMEQREWIEKLQEAILNALNLAPEKKEGKKGVKAADILARIQENPSNKICADCDSEDPSWAIINRGIMVCIECSGVHRSMGVHISKVRSVELDVEIWTETLIQLFQTIGNANSNTFWEKHRQSDKLESSSPREIRETLIRAKYESKSWIPRTMGDSPEVLSKALCVAVAGDDLMRTTELLVMGADPCFVHPDIEDSEKNTPMKIAKANEKHLQAELLEQNGALLGSPSESSQVSNAFRKGYLCKTGSDRKGWKERYCTINAYRGLEYFKSESDVEILGAIKVDSMLGATHCEVDGAGKDKHCFEVITPSRAYLFASETAEDMQEWLATIKEIIPKDNADKLGFDKVGFLSKRSPQNVGWKKRWFSLKDKKLTYFKKEEIASIDMKSITNIKPPEQGSFESMCSFQILTPDRVYYLRADNPTEADSWVQALKQTQVSVPLSEHPLTSGSSGTGIPVLVHKCLQFVEAQGLELEGIYRISGQKPKIIELLQQFNQDPRTVVLDESIYCVHDVTGTLKKFLKSLPDPLLTHQLYQAFLDAAVMSDHETKLHQLQSLIDQLPPVNKETLKRIINHLLKVVHHESSNKMSKSNLTSLFGPTLMSVDGDPVNFQDMQSQYTCIEHMMSYYEWLFNATGEEEKKEEAMQEALKKLEAAKEQHKQQAQVAGMNTSTSFLISVYINDKQDDVCGMKVTLTTTAAEVVEFVTSTKSLPPTNYCVYLVLGESESERPLHSLEQVLAVQTTGSHLCLKKNTMADRIKDYDSYSGQCVMLHVMEKKKWKKYPCAVKLKNFIIYKDNKCQIELHRIPLFDADLFIGIERKNIDVRNPLPTKYPLCLLVRVNNNNKFLCADTVEDRLMISAAVIFSKHPDGIQTPVMPVKTVPKMFDARNRGISILNPLGSGGGGTNSQYLNFKPNASTKTHIPKKNVGDERLLRELTHRQKSTSPDRPSIA